MFVLLPSRSLSVSVSSLWTGPRLRESQAGWPLRLTPDLAESDGAGPRELGEKENHSRPCRAAELTDMDPLSPVSLEGRVSSRAAGDQGVWGPRHRGRPLPQPPPPPAM